MNSPTNYTLPPNKVLVLRTCSSHMESYNGFKWPESGPVECPDWSPEPGCGNGLHGWLWGEGDGYLGKWFDSAKWLVVEVEKDHIVDLDGKVKFPKGVVVFCGDRGGATDFLRTHDPHSATRRVIGATVKAGDGGIATVGYGGTATAGRQGIAVAGHRGTAITGNRGTAITGNHGTATAGYKGTATAGYGGTATVGHEGTATVGEGGNATAGDEGIATAGVRGTATAGYEGIATAGYEGIATAGYKGTATAGFWGTAKAGDGGVITIRFWDRDEQRSRMVTATVDGDKIKPNVAYRLNSNGEFVED